MPNITTKFEVVLENSLSTMTSREAVTLLSLVHNFLDNKETGPCLAIQGQHGIGKTSLLRYLYQDELRCKKYQNVVFIEKSDLEKYYALTDDIDNYKDGTISVINNKLISFFRTDIFVKQNLLIIDDIDLIRPEYVYRFLQDINNTPEFKTNYSKVIFSYRKYLSSWSSKLLEESNILSLELAALEPQKKYKAILFFDANKTSSKEALSVLTEFDSIYHSITGDYLVINSVENLNLVARV